MDTKEVASIKPESVGENFESAIERSVSDRETPLKIVEPQQQGQPPRMFGVAAKVLEQIAVGKMIRGPQSVPMPKGLQQSNQGPHAPTGR